MNRRTLPDPAPRPPFPGDWQPEMAERGLSLWCIRMAADLRDPQQQYHVVRYEQVTPSVPVPYEPIRDTSDGKGPAVQLDGWIIAATPPEAIEAMAAHIAYQRERERS